MLLRVVVVLVVIGVTVYALVDCWGSDGPSVRLLPRPLWFLVVLIPIVGPVLWLVAGRPREEPRAPAVRPLAPDDDPEFLRRLDLERRRRAAEEERRRRRERQDGNGQEGPAEANDLSIRHGSPCQSLRLSMNSWSSKIGSPHVAQPGAISSGSSTSMSSR